MRLIICFLTVLSLSALTPIGAVHELLRQAIELPDGRMVVLTPARLALLNSSADMQVTDSYWSSSQSFYRGITIKDGHVFLPTRRSVQILRIGEKGFELVSEVDVDYAWAQVPVIHKGHLYLLRGQREIRIFSLADLSAPEQVAELDFENSGHFFSIVKGQLYVASKKRLQIYDISTPRQPRKLDKELEIAGSRFGAMHIEGDILHIFSDKGLNLLDITDPVSPTLTATHKKVPIFNTVIVQPNGWFGFYGSNGMKLVTTDKGEFKAERLPFAWRIEAKDPAKVAADFERSGLFSPRPLTGGAVLDSLVVVFNGVKAQVFDVADSANPKRLSSIDFWGGPGASIIHGKRLYTRSGFLDLSDPKNPVTGRFRGSSNAVLEGDILYASQGRHIQLWDLSGPEPREVAELNLKRSSFMFTLYNGHLISSNKGGLVQIAKIGKDGIEPVSDYQLEGERERPYSMDMYGQVLYMVHGGAVRAIDLGDLKNPRELTTFRGAKRFQFLDARNGVVVGAPSGRYTEVFDLQTGQSLETGPGIIGARFIRLHGDRVYVGMPPGGVTILQSEALAELEKQEASRAPLLAKLDESPNEVKTLAKLAVLCNEQGAVWEAERHISTLDTLELDEETRAMIDEFHAARARRHELIAAEAAFRKAINDRVVVAYRGDKEEIVRLRVYKQEAFRAHHAHVVTLPLRSLIMGREPLIREDMALLEKLPGLKLLTLDGIPEGENPLAALAGLKQLQTLILEDVELPPGSLAPIAGLTKLESLDLEDTGVGDADLAYVAGLTGLQHLDLEGCEVTDAGLVHLRELRKLGRLRLEDCPITGSGLANLAGLSELRSLNLEGMELETGLAAIGTLTQLRELDLAKSTMSDDEFAHLASLTELEVLNLYGSELSDEVIPQLSALNKLKRLNLDGNLIGDPAMETIGGLNALEDLSLQGTDVSDEGLLHLAKLPKLEALDLEDVGGITDRGLAALAESASLRRLDVRNTQVTADGAAQLPNTRVEWKERQERVPQEQREEEARIAAMPKTLSFRLAQDALLLLDAETDAEFARETPADLFGTEAVKLQALAAWEGRCWVGSNLGLLRFEPQTRVWSRFAVDREHLSVAITGLEIVDEVLEVTYGEGQSARFDLKERRWHLAPVAVVASATNEDGSSTGGLKWSVILLVVILLLVSGGLLARRVLG
jgi:Leucine-rich repeat (LRR) protein